MSVCGSSCYMLAVNVHILKENMLLTHLLLSCHEGVPTGNFRIQQLLYLDNKLDKILNDFGSQMLHLEFSSFKALRLILRVLIKKVVEST